MRRPHFQSGIVEMERLFAANPDRETLCALNHELTFRDTQRAKNLKSKVDRALSATSPSSDLFTHTGRPASPRPDKANDHYLQAPVATPRRARLDNGAIRTTEPMPLNIDNPTAILDAWTALEALAPATFRRPEQLAGGNRLMAARFENGALPWERGEKARPGTKLFYHVVLGSIDVGGAVERLLKVYADDRPERQRGKEQAALASILVDRDGRPVAKDGIAVSSFGWGVPVALTGSLKELGGWTDCERRLVSGLENIVAREDGKGNIAPLTRRKIDEAFAWLIEELRLDHDLVASPTFAIRAYVPFKRGGQPEALLLNSFYLNDLAKARLLAEQGKLPAVLRFYLGDLRPDHRLDLLADAAALSNAVSPGKFPASRWPGRGGHPLVLLQQAAVNLYSDPKQTGPLLGVNGPPGTGKTTLLRDIVADQVTQRAERMLAFANPADAFTHSRQKLRAGNGWIHLYQLAPALRGFEVVVASSNNKAVENVSAELPGMGAIGDDIGLDYFRSLSDALLERETWGLIAAVLGNANNRYRFKNMFWWDEEHGLRRYLLQATGTEQFVEARDAKGEIIERRRPKILQAQMPPRDEREALQLWHVSKKRFADALARSRALIAELELVRKRTRFLPKLLDVADEHRQLRMLRPSFWSRLFRTARFRDWSSRFATNVALLGELVNHAALPPPLAAAVRKKVRLNLDTTFENQHREMTSLLDAARLCENELGIRAMGASFAAADRETQQKTAPWLPDEVHRARSDVFVAAMELHKAFVDAAAKPLRHNLGALMDMFGGPAPASPEVARLVPDLWSTLFMVAPVVSTTFASVDRMLGGLPPETLGCLIVDEAGQATPQAAVGAMMRARRALVVGDPIQVPPVVTLPDSLTATICRRFGVDPLRFNPPESSVQTLADAASTCCAEFEGDIGSRTVGAPLLVHRRCADPMFSIANRVAYSGLMVQAKAGRASPIRDVLGAPAWIDIDGAAQDKWCPREGEVAIDLLYRLMHAGVAPDLFIVTPFVAVQDGLRRAVADDERLAAWLPDPAAWVNDRIGTIHTVQGREAEAVIFVLGAPRADQQGARNWAGRQPNLLNVAVTRAKETLYVIGSRSVWQEVGVFKALASHLPPSPTRLDPAALRFD